MRPTAARIHDFGHCNYLLRMAHNTYAQITAGSFGYQAGVKGFHYTLFLMNDKAIDRLDAAGGLQLGMGPSLVLVKEGGTMGFTTTTLDKDIYAFVYDAGGVFGGVGIEGTKITKIKAPD